MTEYENDGFYWVPEPEAPLRQGDLLVNVPIAILPAAPEFVLRHRGADDSAQLVGQEAYPDAWPTDEVVLQVRWGAMAMVMTPTCHVSEGEKDAPFVAVVPVEPLAMVVSDEGSRRDIRGGGKSPLHLFHLPPTDLAKELLPIDHVALLDRPGTFPKDDLRAYRRLALFRDARYELRKELAWFWARSGAPNLQKELEAVTKAEKPLDEIE